MPRWAFGDAAVRVQPPTLSASEGFRVGTRVPGPWLNWQFNALGGWIDFLRAPNVNAFARVSWATSPGSYDSSSPVLLACDADTIETTGAAYRIVIAGWETSGPTSSLQVSQTGNAWTRRTNTPGGFGRPTALAHIACAPRWVIADDGPGLYYAPHDAGAGTSPIGGSSSGWTAATAADDGSGGVTAIKAIASSTSKAVAITAAGGLWSADGITWSAITEGTARTGNGLDVVWTGSAFVYVTSDGEVYSSPTADGSFALKGTLPDGAADWRLAAGDAGEVLAYQHNNGSASDLFRSTNDGASWSTLTPLAVGRDVLRLTCVRWRDGVWMATSSVAPFLWTSNDAVNWTALRVDVSGSGALQSIAWDGSAWIAAGNGFVVRCPRGADPAPGDYVADGDPATLADAASLRGRRIETGDPSDGDTLVWNAADEQWEYGAGGGSAATPPLALPSSVRDAVAWLDPETLPDVANGTSLRTWVGLHGELARLYAGTAPTLNATAPASLDYSAAGGCQRVEGLSISGAAPRSLAALITRGAFYGKKWLVVWGYLYGIYLYGHTPQVEHGTGAVLDAGAAIDGERHLLVSTYDGSVGKLYVDGALVDTRTYGALTSTAQPLALAARGDSAYEPFNGRIHAAGAWDRALSAAEVTALHTWLTSR